MENKADTSISRCAADVKVAAAGLNLMEAARGVEQDSANFLAALLGIRIQIERYYEYKENTQLGAQDAEAIFQNIVEQSLVRLEPEQQSRIYQLFEHTHSFLNNALKGNFKNDPVLNLIRPTGDTEDTVEQKPYIYFLMQNLSTSMMYLLQASLGDEQPTELPENVSQKNEDHKTLKDLTKSIHREIGSALKTNFEKEFGDIPVQELTNIFKDNNSQQRDLQLAVNNLNAIALECNTAKEISEFMGISGITLENERVKDVSQNSFTYQQEIDSYLHEIFASPVLSKNPSLLAQAIKSCASLADTMRYKPELLNTEQKNLFNTHFAKAKLMKIIESSKSRLGGILQDDEQQEKALNKAANNLVGPLISVKKMIEIAEELSTDYGKRGGIYTIPNLIWEALTRIFGKSQSRTHQDLSKAVKELEKLQKEESPEQEQATKYSINR